MEFKVGDWVRIKCLNKNTRIDYIAHNKRGYRAKHKNYCINDNNYTDEQLELWKPKVGEWLWYNKNLVQFTEVREDNTFKLTLATGQFYIALDFNNCEPFTGELPSFIKDK